MRPSRKKILDTYKFISEVREYKCLYDNDVRRSVSPEVIDQVWNDIIDKCELPITVNQAKRKWYYLYSQHKEDIMNDFEKPSTFHSSLTFLNKYILKNLNSERDERESSNNDRENRLEKPSRSTTRIRPRRSILKSTSRSRSPQRSYVDCNCGISSRQSISHRDNSPSLRIESQNNSIAANRNINNTNSDDPITSFFLSMACSTKQFSHQLQMEVKEKILAIIHQVEKRNNKSNNK